MALVRFEATKLVQKGKRGILKPDADGYYTTVIGGLNAINSSGHWYADSARYLFEGTDAKSILQRRIKAGNLKGEAGHPKPLPNMSIDDFKFRLLSVEETKVSHHIRRIILDDQFGKNNPEYGNDQMIGIIAEIKPTGPYGPGLKAAFDNPDENVCFSIRGFTDDSFARGRRVRTLFEVVTFDWVTEPGIAAATKWDSPACESAAIETFMDMPISERDIGNMIARAPAHALESDSIQIAKIVQQQFDVRPMAGVKKPEFNIAKW